MPGGDVVPLPLAGEMVEDGGVEPPHPVIRVGPAYAVRLVLERLLGGNRRTSGTGGTVLPPPSPPLCSFRSP